MFWLAEGVQGPVKLGACSRTALPDHCKVTRPRLAETRVNLSVPTVRVALVLLVLNPAVANVTRKREPSSPEVRAGVV